MLPYCGSMFFLCGCAVSLVAATLGSGPYDGYRGWLLSNVTACGAGPVAAVASELESLHCVLLLDEGIFGPVPAIGSNACVTTLAACNVGTALDFKRGIEVRGAETMVVAVDAAAYLSTLDGYTEKWEDSSEPSMETKRGFYGSYRDLASITTRLKRVVSSHSGCSDDVSIALESLSPETHEGRTILALRIQGKSWSHGNPRVIVSGAQHAREWIAAMTAVYMAESAAAMFCAHPLLIQGAELVIVPIVNPDGFEYSARKDRYWRKNRRISSSRSCLGVDLNRNWDIDFGGGRGPGGAADECSEVYSGHAAMSEPETQAVDAILKESPVTVQLDVHSYGQMVLGPWGYASRPFRNTRFNKTHADQLGNAIRNAIVQKHGADYLYGTGDAGGATYFASGMLPDYASSFDAIGYTIELRPGMNRRAGFAPPTSQILPCAEEAMEGLKVAVSWSLAQKWNDQPTTADVAACWGQETSKQMWKRTALVEPYSMTKYSLELCKAACVEAGDTCSGITVERNAQMVLLNCWTMTNSQARETSQRFYVQFKEPCPRRMQGVEFGINPSAAILV